jgi:ferredoxin-NADP reductase
MESELMVGRDVWVKLPYGDFVIDASRPAVLFAGGTGITAFASFLLRSGTLAQPVFLAYGARRPELLLYRDQLKQRSAACPLLRTKLFCETPGPGTSHGRVSASAIWPELGPPAGTPCYLSGPPEMLAALTTELKGLGVADSRIRIDAWE